MNRSKVRIKDVAAAAGVSVTTVSHVLNDVDGKRVNAETRARVREAAERLGYAPNGLARGLRLRRSHTIGLLSDEIATTPFAGKIILGAQEVAKAHDLLLILMNTGGDPDLEMREARLLLQRQVDGVLYATMYHRTVTVPAVLSGAPVVLLNAVSADPAFASVVPDEVAGGWDAADVLIKAGHRSLAFINNSDDIPAKHGRREGFLARAAEAGVDEAAIAMVEACPDAAGGYVAAASLLRRTPRPTGVFCFNDQVAMGLYQAAAEAGLRIPDDVSVVGFDNLELVAAALRPALTTVALPHYQMGVWAATQMIDCIGASSGETSPVRHERLRGPVVHRSSVAPPPRG
jgi:LacI family transcriptional regulator